MAKPIHQLTKTERLFDRIQIGALNVFDDGHFQHLCIIQIANDNGKFVKLRQLGGPPATLPRDYFKAVRAGDRAHDKRLNNTFLAD